MASGLAVSALAPLGAGQEPVRGSQAVPLATLRGETAQGAVVVRTVGTPLAEVGGAVRVASDAGSFLATRKDDATVLVVTAFCSHEACLMTQVLGDEYFCDCHGSRFDREGRVVAGPAEVDLFRFETRLAEGILTIVV